MSIELEVLSKYVTMLFSLRAGPPAEEKMFFAIWSTTQKNPLIIWSFIPFQFNVVIQQYATDALTMCAARKLQIVHFIVFSVEIVGESYWPGQACFPNPHVSQFVEREVNACFA